MIYPAITFFHSILTVSLIGLVLMQDNMI